MSLTLWITLTVLTACSPYPIYNHDPMPPPERDLATDRGARTSRPIAQIDDGSGGYNDADLIPPKVDPGIFQRVVNDYIGVPYRLGGSTTDGIDCSNLIRALYRDYDGTRLPNSTRALYQLPEEVPPDALAPGDLVFFSFDGSPASHVGAFLGSARFVHASESNGVVISSLRDPTYRDRYVGARRVR